jgi:hypothetical protein
MRSASGWGPGPYVGHLVCRDTIMPARTAAAVPLVFTAYRPGLRAPSVALLSGRRTALMF